RDFDGCLQIGEHLLGLRFEAMDILLSEVDAFIGKFAIGNDVDQHQNQKDDEGIDKDLGSFSRGALLDAIQKRIKVSGKVNHQQHGTDNKMKSHEPVGDSGEHQGDDTKEK